MRDYIVQEAMTWIGTPYHHLARCKGVGVDCAQLVIGICENIGLVHNLEVDNYSTEWHLHNREEKLIEIIESLGCVEDTEMIPGNIITFQFGRVNSHLGILMPNNTILHASITDRKVVHHSLVGQWKERMRKIYKLPGVK